MIQKLYSVYTIYSARLRSHTSNQDNSPISKPKTHVSQSASCSFPHRCLLVFISNVVVGTELLDYRCIQCNLTAVPPAGKPVYCSIHVSTNRLHVSTISLHVSSISLHFLFLVKTTRLDPFLVKNTRLGQSTSQPFYSNNYTSRSVFSKNYTSRPNYTSRSLHVSVLFR